MMTKKHDRLGLGGLGGTTSTGLGSTNNLKKGPSTIFFLFLFYLLN
jgi:hypothetical protein